MRRFEFSGSLQTPGAVCYLQIFQMRLIARYQIVLCNLSFVERLPSLFCTYRVIFSTTFRTQLSTYRVRIYQNYFKVLDLAWGLHACMCAIVRLSLLEVYRCVLDSSIWIH